MCRLQCVAVCCSVLQCVAVCCSALQCVAVRYSLLLFVAVTSRFPVCVAVFTVCCSVYSVLQCGLVCCSVLQCVAVTSRIPVCDVPPSPVAVCCSSMLQYIAARCSALQCIQCVAVYIAVRVQCVLQCVLQMVLFPSSHLSPPPLHIYTNNTHTHAPEGEATRTAPPETLGRWPDDTLKGTGTHIHTYTHTLIHTYTHTHKMHIYAYIHTQTYTIHITTHTKFTRNKQTRAR